MNSETLLSQASHGASDVAPISWATCPAPVVRILVADDDEDIRDLVAAVLVRAGFDVLAVADGQQAWEELHRQRYDVLVTDNEMPCLSGIELIERIRKGGMTLPVIIASGTFAMERIRTSPQLQLAAFLPKPFHPKELLNALRRALGTSWQVTRQRSFVTEFEARVPCPPCPKNS